MKKREPKTKQLESWQDEIKRNGTKRLSARHLLRAFGIQRRSSQSNLRVISWLKEQDPPVYTNDLEFLKSLDETIFLTHIKLNRIGHFAESEKFLMDRFEFEIMPQLKLINPLKHFRPDGSRDALDFLCEDMQGNAVVVELKKKDGEKRVVEQVLRYIRQVRANLRYKNPRGIIVTGCEDLHTRRALEELEPSYKIDWYIYGLDPIGKIQIHQIQINN